ncbi:MAG: peptidyl-prolyl cis-trans isomerase [Polyangiaceae bacterium]|nr:peptidyl-prolyl cis-trans isomerase [Polyangiaceae bacterium]
MRTVAAGSLVSALVLAPLGCDKPSADTAPVPSAAAVASTAAAPPPAPSASFAPPASESPPLAASAPAPALTVPDAIIAQHILVAYKTAKRAPKGVTRSKGDAKARAAEALAKLQGGMTFEDAVHAYSDDTGSAERLGSVGKFHREDMDPAFSTAAFALRVGQVSDIVETPFGFHVIKRTQ